MFHVGLTNKAATDHMLKMVKWAKKFDVRRLSTEQPTQGTADAMMAQRSSASEDDEFVFVLCDELKIIKYTHSNPRVRQNACTCHTATQGRCCHHQVAWLVSQYSYGEPTERLIVNKLGVSLGFDDGCSLEDIQCLTDALDDLYLQSCENDIQLHCSEKHSGPQQQAPVAVPAQADQADEPASLPRAILPEAAVPEAAVPEAAVPEAAVPQVSQPRGETAVRNHKLCAIISNG